MFYHHAQYGDLFKDKFADNDSNLYLENK